MKVEAEVKLAIVCCRDILVYKEGSYFSAAPSHPDNTNRDRGLPKHSNRDIW